MTRRSFIQCLGLAPFVAHAVIQEVVAPPSMLVTRDGVNYALTDGEFEALVARWLSERFESTFSHSPLFERLKARGAIAV